MDRQEKKFVHLYFVNIVIQYSSISVIHVLIYFSNTIDIDLRKKLNNKVNKGTRLRDSYTTNLVNKFSK